MYQLLIDLHFKIFINNLHNFHKYAVKIYIHIAFKKDIVKYIGAFFEKKRDA